VYLGGGLDGKRARGAEGKTPFAAALETTEDWQPNRIKLQAAVGSPRLVQIVAEVSS